MRVIRRFIPTLLTTTLIVGLAQAANAYPTGDYQRNVVDYPVPTLSRESGVGIKAGTFDIYDCFGSESPGSGAFYAITDSLEPKVTYDGSAEGSTDLYGYEVFSGRMFATANSQPTLWEGSPSSPAFCTGTFAGQRTDYMDWRGRGDAAYSDLAGKFCGNSGYHCTNAPQTDVLSPGTYYMKAAFWDGPIHPSTSVYFEDIATIEVTAPIVASRTIALTKLTDPLRIKGKVSSTAAWCKDSNYPLAFFAGRVTISKDGVFWKYKYPKPNGVIAPFDAVKGVRYTAKMTETLNCSKASASLRV